MILKIKKSKPVSPMPIEVPPSKSHSMRALVLAAFAEGSSQIKNLLMSGDTKTAVSVFESLGVKFKIEQKNISSADIIVFPPKEGLKKRIEKQKQIKIDAGNSGTLFYFLGSILSLMSSDFILTGDSSILKRPAKPLIEIYEELGLKYEFLDSFERAPIRVLPGSSLIKNLKGKTCAVSGSGNVAQFAAEKLIACGARVLTLSDSSGFIYDKDGIDETKLSYIKQLKNVERGRISEYVKKYPSAEFTQNARPWTVPVDCAFPCATQNEMDETNAQTLVQNGVKLVAEGANMPCTPEAVQTFQKAGVLFAPGKASNAGGVAVSGLEMSQNSMRYSWTREEVDAKLKTIMKDIHDNAYEAAERFGIKGNYVAGANIAGFLKVAEAMIAQGVI